MKPMAADSDPEAFRAKATAAYRRARVFLAGLVVVAAGAGFLIGALVGLAIDTSDAPHFVRAAGGWLVGGLIGLGVGAACGAVVAAVLWFAATFFYAMTQDGA